MDTVFNTLKTKGGIKIDNNCISIHAFYHNHQKYDEFICKIVDRLGKYKDDNMIDKWFFIRYWEGGPHFRFRIFNAKSDVVEKEIIKEMEDYFLNNPSENKITREEYYKNSKFDGKVMNIDELPWYDEGEVVNIKYEPEIQRYGGKNVIEYSESLFMESSYLAKNLILATENNFTKRLIYSSAITFILAKSLTELCGEDDINKFFEFYKTMWRNFIDSSEYEEKLKQFLTSNIKAMETVKENLLGNKGFNKYLNSIKNIFKQIIENIESPEGLRYIIASHIHMTNNRLGVTPLYEYYISETLINVFS